MYLRKMNKGDVAGWNLGRRQEGGCVYAVVMGAEGKSLASDGASARMNVVHRVTHE
jgi:hypothetical protein